MRSLFDNKRLVILLSLLSLGLMVLLSRGLNNIPFREGLSFNQGLSNSLRAVSIQIARSMTAVPLEMLIAMWVILGLTFLLLGLLLTPEWRKRLIRIVIRVGIIYWALYIVFTRYREMLARMDVDPAALASDEIRRASDGQAPPAFASPETLRIVSYLVSFGVAVLLIILGRKALAFWNELKTADAQPLKRIAKIARTSIDDLSGGRGSTDVIMNCYYRMNDAVSGSKRLERGASVTPTEFAARLEAAGLPSDAVRRLTRLFESVRYGGHRSSPAEVREAVASLNAILAHCGESV
jgi:hypothetical protein